MACAEAAGVWSHYYAEEALGHPLEEPYMEIAIEGFREEMIIEGYLNRKLENERRIRKKAEIESLKKQRARVADAGYGD